MSFSEIIKAVWAKKYIITFLAVWTFGVSASAALNLHGVYKDTISKAFIEAKTITRHNMAYRRWNSSLGGIYAQISDGNKPNPYLLSEYKHTIRAEGLHLTLISPFQMTKQVNSLLREDFSELPTINRLVSLNPLNPENTPDKWERRALQTMLEKKGEFSQVSEIYGYQYMRLITSYDTTKECLPCHKHQGYEIGDIKGGISVSVPMAPYSKSAATTQNYIIITHFILWIVGLLTIAIFFIGLKKYREDIDESSKKFKIVSEFAHDFEYWLTEKPEMVFISPSCQRITGYSREEFYNRPSLLFDLVYPDDVNSFKEHLTNFKEAIHEDYQYRIITKEGQIRWLSHTCSPINIGGKFLGRRGSIRDISNQKALEEQLLQTQKVECIGHFAGGIAHDFNNVLSSITTFLHILECELDANQTDLKKYINYINIAAKLGMNLTSNLLAFGRPQAVNLKVVNLNSIVKNISELVKTLLTADVIFDLSLCKNEVPVFVDPHQVEQIIINFCTNARDAMAEGGKLSIKTKIVSLKEPLEKGLIPVPSGRYMKLSVSDTGHGIAKDDIRNIFEPFYSTKASNKGTGLGLAIIHNIIKQHKSFIDVESEPDKGTKFTVYFPASSKPLAKIEATAVPVEREKEPAEPPPRDELPIEASKKTILLVEDEKIVRESLNAILELRGFNIITAVDGQEALEKFSRYKDSIELLILDIMLPKVNGKEVYDRIKKQQPAIKAFFLSGYTGNVNITQSIHNEGLELLQKPVDIDSLVTRVEEILQA